MSLFKNGRYRCRRLRLVFRYQRRLLHPNGENEWLADANSAVSGRIDLLTALSHEFGLHGLKPDDSAPGIMNDELGVGTRRKATL